MIKMNNEGKSVRFTRMNSVIKYVVSSKRTV
ncbi:hypothetical protein T09_5413 [Trichinella sp. T9]|nr:hypothetical protein T09_5413 [Trichinella sp. T9]